MAALLPPYAGTGRATTVLVRTRPGHERGQRADVHDPAAPELDHVGQHELHEPVAREQPDLEVQAVPLEREAEERTRTRRGGARRRRALRRAGARRGRARPAARSRGPAGHGERGVVHQQVDRSECGARLVDQPVDVVVVGEVGADRHRAPALGLDGGDGVVDGARQALVEDLLRCAR